MVMPLSPRSALRFNGVYAVRHVIVDGQTLSPTTERTAGNTHLNQFALTHANANKPAGNDGEDWFGSAKSDLYSPKRHLGWEFLILNDGKGTHFKDWNDGVIHRKTHQSAQEAFQQRLAEQATPADFIVTTSPDGATPTYQVVDVPVKATKPARTKTPTRRPFRRVG